MPKVLKLLKLLLEVFAVKLARFSEATFFVSYLSPTIGVRDSIDIFPMYWGTTRRTVTFEKSIASFKMEKATWKGCLFAGKSFGSINEDRS